MADRKAYRVHCDGLMPCIVAAMTAGKARARSVANAHDAGYRSVTFTSLRVTRAEEYDEWASRNDGKSCIEETELLAEVIRA